MSATRPPQVTVVGGGMITQIQILPSLYHLQRVGAIGQSLAKRRQRVLRAKDAVAAVSQQVGLGLAGDVEGGGRG